MGIAYLKSAAMLFYKLYDLWLSNELLIIILAQGDAKVRPFKVGGLKKALKCAKSNSVFVISYKNEKWGK